MPAHRELAPHQSRRPAMRRHTAACRLAACCSTPDLRVGCVRLFKHVGTDFHANTDGVKCLTSRSCHDHSAAWSATTASLRSGSAGGARDRAELRGPHLVCRSRSRATCSDLPPAARRGARLGRVWPHAPPRILHDTSLSRPQQAKHMRAAPADGNHGDANTLENQHAGRQLESR